MFKRNNRKCTNTKFYKCIGGLAINEFDKSWNIQMCKTSLWMNDTSLYLDRVNSICMPPLDLKNGTPQSTNPSIWDHCGSFNLYFVSNISS